MKYTGLEKRKNTRIFGRFVLSYKVKSGVSYDITQTRNISSGGMVLTTDRKFEAGTILNLNIRLPSESKPIQFDAKVLDSREVTKDLIYDTHIEFLEVKDKEKLALDEIVKEYSKKQHK